jgi:alcohol dehydrogenase class IV
MQFEFATATRIVFGAGRLREAGEIAKGLGKDALVLTGRTPKRAEPLLAILRDQGMRLATFAVPGEPEVETIRLGVARAREEQCDCVIGFGGGAVIDAAKAIAVLLTNRGDVEEYLEIIGRGKRLVAEPVPVMAIPTTAGTGAEVARNSVLVSRAHRVKVSLRSPMMVPKVALVDPELTYDLPPAITASTGLDALVQLIEPFVCTRANPLTDGICKEGMVRVARSLHRAFVPGRDVAAREDMAIAGLFGGLALTNAGLGAVHGLAGPLGGMIKAPHGAICAVLLPPVVAANLRALRERQPASEALARYEKVAQLLTGDSEAMADEAVGWLGSLVADLGIPKLRSHGFGAEEIPELVEKASRASSMKANPIELTPDELASIVAAAL